MDAELKSGWGRPRVIVYRDTRSPTWQTYSIRAMKNRGRCYTAISRVLRQGRDEAVGRWSDIPGRRSTKHVPSGGGCRRIVLCGRTILPDYVAKSLPMRQKRGWSWFQFNWAYERASTRWPWRLAQRLRTEEQMFDLQQEVYAHEWQLPMDSPSGMVIYA